MVLCVFVGVYAYVINPLFFFSYDRALLVQAGNLTKELQTARDELTQIKKMWEIAGETVVLEKIVGKASVLGEYARSQKKRAVRSTHHQYSPS